LTKSRAFVFYSLIDFYQMVPYNLNTSYKSHAIVGLLVAIWLVLFLVFVAPFDASDLSFKIRLLLLPPYGIIFFLCYMSVVFFQNWIFQKLKYWNFGLEVFIFTLIYFAVLYFSFLYYQSRIINGDWPFSKFLYAIYLPTWVLLGFPIFFARWFIARKKPEKEIEVKIIQPKLTDKITLKGDNKLDVLQVDFKNLVCISSAQNYVEVFFLQNKILQKKLLRTTLKKISQDAPEMTQVHRSHLVNPTHFVKWINPSTISLHDLEIPVSKNYKEKLNGLI